MFQCTYTWNCPVCDKQCTAVICAKQSFPRYCSRLCRRQAKSIRKADRLLATEIVDRQILLRVHVTHTESPSTNIRVMCKGYEIFYNSDRLSGPYRALALLRVLGATRIKNGEGFIVSQKQYNRIAELNDSKGGL